MMVDTAAYGRAKAGPRTRPVKRCPACGSTGARFFFNAIDRLHGIAGEYTYRRCTECRTVFQDPRVLPQDLSLCYPNDYYTHIRRDGDQPVTPAIELTPRRLSGLRGRIRQAIASAVQGVQLPGVMGFLGRTLGLSRRLRERAFYNYVIDELIPRAPGRLRALEVGCGSGYLMPALRRAGWEVEAVEWDPIAARTARELTGCQVWQGDFRTVDLAVEAYDLVVLHHVFEHLDEPVEALQRIRALLKPNGRAVLVYPNPDALGAKIFGSVWFAWDAPRHLVLVTREAMASVSKRAGLSVSHVRTSGSQAAFILAFSRAYHAGRAVNDSPDICYLDLAAALLERALVALGFKTGEELIFVLRQAAPLQGNH